MLFGKNLLRDIYTTDYTHGDEDESGGCDEVGHSRLTLDFEDSLMVLECDSMAILSAISMIEEKLKMSECVERR